jgi:hypothetical protein
MGESNGRRFLQEYRSLEHELGNVMATNQEQSLADDPKQSSLQMKIQKQCDALIN